MESSENSFFRFCACLVRLLWLRVLFRELLLRWHLIDLSIEPHWWIIFFEWSQLFMVRTGCCWLKKEYNPMSQRSSKLMWVRVTHLVYWMNCFSVCPVCKICISSRSVKSEKSNIGFKWLYQRFCICCWLWQVIFQLVMYLSPSGVLLLGDQVEWNTEGVLFSDAINFTTLCKMDINVRFSNLSRSNLAM